MEIEDKYKELIDCKYLLVWNKLEKWGDENDRLFRVNSITSKEGKSFYSGEVLEYININSKGLKSIPIPFIKINNASENQFKSIENYLSIIGRKPENLNFD